MHFSKKFKALVGLLSVVLMVSTFNVSALAVDAKDNSIDEQTAVRKITELFEKYCPGTATVGQPTNYSPVDADAFYSELAAIEAKLQEHSNPDLAIKIITNADGSYSVSDPAKFSSQIESKFRELSTATDSSQARAPLANSENYATTAAVKTVSWSETLGNMHVIDIPWPATTMAAGYSFLVYGQSATTPTVPAYWFTSYGKVSPVKKYSGIGTSSVSITSKSLKWSTSGGYKYALTAKVLIEANA